jgi:SRSO17 transposase
VPRGWIEDPGRCRLAGIPERVGFATKPALATQMLARTLDAGVPAAWVTGDEVYGGRPAAAHAWLNTPATQHVQSTTKPGKGDGS